MELVVGAAYLPYDSSQLPPTPKLARLVDRMRIERSELLVGCDAYSHHIRWGSTDSNEKGDFYSDFIISENILVLNRSREPTFREGRRQEVLDMTICSAGLSGCVKKWRVSEEPSCLDHSQIRMNLEGRDQQEPMSNPRHTDWVRFWGELALRIQNISSNFEDKGHLDIAAERFSEAVRYSF